MFDMGLKWQYGTESDIMTLDLREGIVTGNVDTQLDLVPVRKTSGLLLCHLKKLK